MSDGYRIVSDLLDAQREYARLSEAQARYLELCEQLRPAIPASGVLYLRDSSRFYAATIHRGEVGIQEIAWTWLHDLVIPEAEPAVEPAVARVDALAREWDLPGVVVTEHDLLTGEQTPEPQLIGINGQ